MENIQILKNKGSEISEKTANTVGSESAPLDKIAREAPIKKIAFISDHAAPLATIGGTDSGGQNIYVAQLAIHLSKMGYAIDIFTRKTGRGQKTVYDWLPGIRVIHVPAGPASEIPKEELWPFMPAFADYIRQFISRHGIHYHLVHAHFWMSGWIARQLKQLLGIPFVITFHALGKVRLRHQKSSDKFPAERVQIEQDIIKEADKIIAECPQDSADLCALYQAPLENTVLVPCGFDPLEFTPIDPQKAREKLQLPLGVPIILQLGRMVPRKGIDNVIRALKYLKLQHKNKYDKATLLIVGGNFEPPSKNQQCPCPDLKEWERLNYLIKKYGLENQVIFYGAKSRAELKFFYAAADVFVSTPWYEPFGITPLEAMACARPVIGSSVGGLKFTIKEGRTGLLVPPKQPLSLARSLHHLFSHPAIMENMGRQGLSRVHKYFTWEKVAIKMDSIYHKMMYPVKIPATIASITAQPPQTGAPYYLLKTLKNG